MADAKFADVPQRDDGGLPVADEGEVLRIEPQFAFARVNIGKVAGERAQVLRSGNVTRDAALGNCSTRARARRRCWCGGGRRIRGNRFDAGLDLTGAAEPLFPFLLQGVEYP